MKRKDIQDLPLKEAKELKTLLKDKEKELFESHLEHTMGKLKNTRLLSQTRDDIARVKTVLRQKEVQNGKKA